MKILALHHCRQLDDRAHDGEPCVNNAYGDRCEKHCLDLAALKTRHRGCGENDEKDQEWDANCLDVESDAHRTVDDKPDDRGDHEGKS